MLKTVKSQAMLKTAKIVGLNSDTTAALALICEPQISSGLTEETAQRFYILVYCQVEDAFSRVRQALLEAENTLPSVELPVSQQFTEVLKKIEESLSDTEEKDILLAATQEEADSAVLYLFARKGFFQATLTREGKTAHLNNAEADFQLISGALKPGDLIALTTNNLLDLIGHDLPNWSETPLDEMEEEINDLLPQSTGGPVAGVLIQVPRIEKEIKEDHFTEIELLPNPAPKKRGPVVYLPKLIAFSKRFMNRFWPSSVRGTAILGLGLLLVVLVGAGFVYRHKKDTETTAIFDSHLQTATTSLGQAESLKDLDAQTAASQLAKAKSEVSLALKMKPEDNSAINLQKQIEEAAGSILKVYPVSDFPLWLDLDLVKRGFSATQLSLSHGNLLLLDPTSDVLIKIDLTTKAPQILAGPADLGQGKLASLNGDNAWVFSTDKGVLKTDLSSQKTTIAIKPDSGWGRIDDIYGFASNLYIVDEGKNQIWKYVPVENGYSDRLSYFKDGTSAALVGTKRLQIDSSVWVLRNGGEIDKYTEGVADFFSFAGLDKPVVDPKSFFVSDQTSNLYLLDSGNSRLLVLDKKGNYKAQYTSGSFANFTDLVVDEAGKKAYFLQGGKIFQMDLQ